MQKEYIETVHACPACETNDWYSLMEYHQSLGLAVCKTCFYSEPLADE